MQKPGIVQVFPRLQLFSNANYRGIRRTVRGNLGIRNLEARCGDVESLRFFSTNRNATLVLFSRTNFQGTFRIFRGIRNIADLDGIIAGRDSLSLVQANFRLTLEQIRTIQRNRRLPAGFRLL